MTTRDNILITGASSGLGAGMARLFAAQGRNLALCARRLDRLEALKTELEGINPSITVRIKPLDVNDYDQVFQVFHAFQEEMGRLDRIIVNAGLGKGQPLGTGAFHANRQTAETNFVAALAQCEAAMEIFRAQNDGHLVMMSSMSALRGMRKNINTYAATKAGVASLAEGLRMEMLGKPIKVSTIYPGYIRSEINEKVEKAPFIVDTETGCKALVAAIEREPAKAFVPSWPWRPLGLAMRVLPLSWVRRMT
ncbi:MAG: short chain dehydrogenase [Alcanivorax sp.]|nr:short chain dehydrogenase [Alcanivorax sp.]MBM1142643.1 SDR family oxidoreductase [Alcanivorax sp. ZXX171]MBU59448.1 short chain dehydrogenase [Alcanivorax sp.]HCE39188.1 short chain dehydrogenase [Alcanivorax sp.]|tara:strand:+ start:230 stop:982 length:753 start_codon:yes stop_codon:yes gene_type:complete